jgi:hypothetical protein
MTLRTLSLAAAIATIVLAPAAGYAAPQHHNRASAHASRTLHASARTTTRRVTTHRSSRGRVTTRRVTTRSVNRPRASRRNVVVHRNVVVNRNVRIGRRYYGGVWYGARRHYWRGRWYAYGIGPCWLATPIGYVWVCR